MSRTWSARAVITVIALAFGAGPAHAASINIPAIHVRASVTRSIDEGPAWWPATGRPGDGDTVAIAGHRTTHTRPFHDLDKLRPGDRIYVRWHGRVYAYVVTSRQIVSSSDMHIADGLGYERLLLTACAKRDGTPTSASYRLVVRALPVTPPCGANLRWYRGDADREAGCYPVRPRQ